MPQRLLWSLAVLLTTSSLLSAQALSIDHAPVGCVVAERFPRLEARFAPGENVATARVLFQPESGRQWYAVAMKPARPAFAGILPKPKKSLKAFRYYIEVTDTALGTNRTPEYTTRVVAGAADCKDRLMGGALGSASVLLQVPAGAAAVPVGFSGAGVVAAGAPAAAAGSAAGSSGGGVGSTALVIAGGAAVAGIAVAVATKGGSSPAPDITRFYGTYASVTYRAQVSGCASFSAAFSVSGNADGSNFQVAKTSPGGLITFTGTIQGSGAFTAAGGGYSMTGQTTGSRISGTETQSGGPLCAWTFDGVR
jgi:hypothetical protein